MSEARQRLYRTEGIIIRRIDLGETDRILTVYTPGRGKLRAVAKGIRRPGSRLAGHVELLIHSNLLVARGRNLDIITQAQTVHAYVDLRRDLDRIGWACYMAELLDQMAPERAENEPAFHLLLAALDHLDRGQNPEMIARSFELHLLGYMGYRPELFLCVSCEEELEPRPQVFSALLGGVLCPRCREEDANALPLPLGAFKVLRYLQRSSLQGAARLRLGNGRRREVERLLHTYIRMILERELKAADFIHHLRRSRSKRGKP